MNFSKATGKHLTLVRPNSRPAVETEWDEFYYGVMITAALDPENEVTFGDYVRKQDIIVGIAAEDNLDLGLTDWDFLQFAVDAHNAEVLHANVVEVLNK